MSSDNEKVYEVEEIIDKRTRNGITEYKVKWEGYSLKQCTWEPLANLMTVKDMVDDFEESYEEPSKKLINNKRTRNEEENTKEDREDINKPTNSIKTVNKNNKKYLDSLKDINIIKVTTVNRMHNILHAQILYNDKGKTKRAWVPTSLMKSKAPDMLIDFYEERISFS